MAESKTDELIKDAPTTQHDKSGEWQETSGEIQWVSTEKTDGSEEKPKKEEEDEELDLNKGIFILSVSFKQKKNFLPLKHKGSKYFSGYAIGRTSQVCRSKVCLTLNFKGKCLNKEPYGFPRMFQGSNM